MPINLITKEKILAERGDAPSQLGFAANFRLDSVVRETVAEFIGTGDVSEEFITRRRYEVDAGRDMEPLLFGSIYDPIIDSTLPEIIPIHVMGPGGVVLEELREGEEVKFATIGDYEKSVRLHTYGVAVEYTKEMRIFNRLFQVPMIERRAGIAYNAKINQVQFEPIRTYTYTAANQTDGTALDTFLATASLPEKYLRTLEAAIVASTEDPTNPRRGPYDLVVAAGDMFTVERMLNRVNQEGTSVQSSALGMIQNVIVYNGWTGVRGKKSFSYPGVASGKAYLVHKGNKMEDWMYFVKQPLEMVMGNPDVSRRVEAQTVWDTFFTVYAAPNRAVEEITWPGATDGETPGA
jgi:hypothetical protein